MTKKFTRLEFFQAVMLEFAKLDRKIDELQKEIDELKPPKFNNKVNIDHVNPYGVDQLADCISNKYIPAGDLNV